jgi:hypothetical protein
MTRARLLIMFACLALLGMTGKPGMRMAGVGGVTGGGVPPSFVETLLTDTTTRTEPTLPTLGAAGTKITDPTFGTTILRVTDATTEPDVGGHKGVLNSYSTQQAFNSDSTRVFHDGVARCE